MDIFRSKLVSFILLVTRTLALTDKLAYYKLHTLWICNVFIVQETGVFMPKMVVKDWIQGLILYNHVLIYATISVNPVNFPWMSTQM